MAASRNTKTTSLRNILYIDGKPIWVREESFHGHGELRFNQVSNQWHGQAYNVHGDMILSCESHDTLSEAYGDIVSQSRELEFVTENRLPWLIYDPWLKPDGTEL
jgi:uncharacterized protein YvpB